MPFIFGLLAAAFAFIAELTASLFYPSLFLFTLPLTFWVVLSLGLIALIEEGSRLLFARQYLITHKPRSWLLAALLFGIGFALPEATLSWWNEPAWPALLASLLHVLLSVFTFWWLGRFRNTRQRTWVLFLLLTITHFLFNLAVLLGGSV
jgi:hypothetical protein